MWWIDTKTWRGVLGTLPLEVRSQPSTAMSRRGTLKAYLCQTKINQDALSTFGIIEEIPEKSIEVRINGITKPAREFRLRRLDVSMEDVVLMY